MLKANKHKIGTLLLILFLFSGYNSWGHTVNYALEKAPTGDVVWYYFKLGVQHIIPLGLDHILFIVGLCSLGLPGLSGFVAEMTIFMGSWENADTFHRVATIVACMSIVVTAVYILRAIGNVAMGPIKNEAFLQIKDAAWNEKLAAIILVAGILAIVISPECLNFFIRPGADIIMQKVSGK